VCAPERHIYNSNPNPWPARSTQREAVIRPQAWPDRLGPRAVTGSGGHHYSFRWPGRPVSNSVGKVAPGVDVRGECSRLGVRSLAGLPYKLLKRRKGVAA
jgi:hypothetical protein